MVMKLSRTIFRILRSNPLVSSVHLNQTKCIQRYLCSSSSRLTHFQVPYILNLDKSSSNENDSDQPADRYVRQWLNEKVYIDQTLDDFKPYLKNENHIKKMEWILQEYEVVKYESGICPSYLPAEPTRIKEMVEINDKDRLYSYFQFLYSRENRKNAEKLRRSDNRGETSKALRKAHESNIKLDMGIHYDPETGKPYYGKWRNSCFLDLGRKEEYTCLIPQNVAASQFGQKLVIDFSYEDCMLIQEKKSLVKQMCFAIQAIREDEEPFDAWFCSLNESNRTYSLLERSLGWDHNAKFTSHFIHRSSKSYLDLFPDDRHKMIYLCPDSAHDLTEFDDDAIYIIGGLVDRSIIKPVSLAKCKRENIRNVRLPLDRYLSMIGSKVLTIDQVALILVNLKQGKSMEQALKSSVPERKLKKPEQIQFERDRRLLRLSLQKDKRKNLYQ